MRAVLFGASGMVGQALQRECLLDKRISSLTSIVRSPTGFTDEKLKELTLKDMAQIGTLKNDLGPLDVCFYALGISSAGLSEADYTKITYDYAMAAAKVLHDIHPNMTMCFISGAGTDSTGKSNSMWARVKGATENDLGKVGFKKCFSFRPGFIRPMHGVVSKTKSYRVLYAVLGPVYPLIKALAPNTATTSETLAKVMIHVAQFGYEKTVLEGIDINQVAKSLSSY
jgi:uncharacterized protein YbjT (DUF2867 family)